MQFEVLTGTIFRTKTFHARRNAPKLSWQLAVALALTIHCHTQQQDLSAALVGMRDVTEMIIGPQGHGTQHLDLSPALVGSSQFDGAISKNGETLGFPSTSVDENENGVFLQFLHDSVDDTAVAFSASSNLQPELFQHVFSYATPGGDTVYSSENHTSNVVSDLITPEKATAITGKFLRQGNRFKLVDELVLDGEMIMSTEPGHNLKGLTATFEVQITKEFERANGSTVSRRFFRGRVRLKGKQNGQIRIQTQGKIKKRHIGSVRIENGLVHVAFDEAAIPFKTSILLGKDYRLTTLYSSQTRSIGAGTGAEINFSQDVSQLPEFVELRQVPEPVTFSLLTAGVLGLAVRRKARYANLTEKW